MALSSSTLMSDIGFSSDNLAWATSVYLLAEIVMLPTLPFLTKLMSSERVLKYAAFMFLLGTTICMIVKTPELFLVGRALQGGAGGILLPLAHILISKHCTPEDRQSVSGNFTALMGLAPIIGVLWGGYVSLYGVFWLFSGMFFIVLIALFLIIKTPNETGTLQRHDDLKLPVGAVSIGVGLSGILYLVDNAAEHGFFQTDFQMIICTLSLSALLAGVTYEWLTPNPTINLSILKNKNMQLMCIAGLLAGIVVYGFLFTFPYYFMVIRGHAPVDIIPLLLMTAIPQIFLIKPISALCKKYNPAHLAALGAFLFSIASHLSSDISVQTAISDMWLVQIIRALASPMLVVSLSVMLLRTLPSTLVPDGQTLYAISRILGGAIGVSGFIGFTAYKYQHAILTGWGSYQSSFLLFSKNYSQAISMQVWDAVFQIAYNILAVFLMSLCFFLLYTGKHYRRENFL